MALSDCGVQTNASGRELAQHGTPPFPVACYRDDLTQAAVPWHWHEEWEALLVDEGRAVVTVDGRRYTLEAGEGMFLNASALHGAWDGGGCRLRSVVFHPRLVGGGLDSVFHQRYVQPITANAGLKALPLSPGQPWQEEALRCIGAAWSSCVDEPPGFEFAVRADLSRLLFLVAAHCPGPQAPPPERALRGEARVKVMLAYIQDHLAEPLTLAAIAQSAAVSESECLRCFRAMLGTTPIQYLRRLRLQQAAALLRSGSLSVSQVAARCGFWEMSYFSKAFRAYTGHTPTAYRRLHHPAGP